MKNIIEGCKIKQFISSRNLGEFFFDGSTKYGPKICQIDATTHQQEYFSSVKQRSVRLAIRLKTKQIQSTDVVAFCTENSLDNIIPVLATFYLGAKVANLDPTLSPRHTRHLLSLVEPKIIFVESSSVKLIEESLESTKIKPELIIFGSQKFYELMQPDASEDLFRPVETDEDDVAVMFFSSGTTGLPKAICHSHKSFLQMINAYYNCQRHDFKVLHFTTLYWISGMMILSAIFIDGDCRIFSHELSAENIFGIVAKYKVTAVFLAPIHTYKLTGFKDAKNFDVASVTTFLTGGTPMSVAQHLRLQALFPNADIVFGYGMTECGMITLFDPETHRELMNKKVGSCGKLIPGVTAKIVDPDSEKSLGANERGEIRAKTSALMAGYYNASSVEQVDSEGFLKTGDIGYFDEDDCFYVIDRIKEMFKYLSWHIVPSAIEAVLLEHPCVQEAIVFGVPKAEDGDVPAACVVLKNDLIVNEEEIEEFVAQRVSDKERLRGGVFFVAEIPKTPSGKPVRREVKDVVKQKMVQRVQ